MSTFAVVHSGASQVVGRVSVDRRVDTEGEACIRVQVRVACF